MVPTGVPLPLTGPVPVQSISGLEINCAFTEQLDTGMQWAAIATLTNLAINGKLPRSRLYVVKFECSTLLIADNKLLIVKLNL